MASDTVTVSADKELFDEVRRLRATLYDIIAYPNLDARDIAVQGLRVGPVSKRGQVWLEFSHRVLSHIENYTVPQYGDAGNDQVTDWTADDCAKQVNKYFGRRGRNSRPGQESLDMLKAAHYVQLTEEKDCAGYPANIHPQPESLG